MSRRETPKVGFKGEHWLLESALFAARFDSRDRPAHWQMNITSGLELIGMALILFNKPYGVLCQFTDEREGPSRPTLADFIKMPGVYPAGRLDTDSEGLLLLTDDGRLQARIADPRFKTPKTYLVQVEGEPDAAALDALRRGVKLKDGLTLPAEAERIDDPALWPRDPPVRFRKTVADCWIKLTIHEGRNRQVRRMTAAVGHPTLRLVRWSVGRWSLDGLAQGEWREAPEIATGPFEHKQP